MRHCPPRSTASSSSPAQTVRVECVLCSRLRGREVSRRRSPTSWLHAGLLLTLLGSAGCRSGWELGRDHYRDARYPDALSELRAAEADYPELSGQERARYALYRGLAHLAVGDAVAADGWLRLAKLAADQDPLLFSPAELGQLNSAWRSLGRMPGQGAFGPAWLSAR